MSNATPTINSKTKTATQLNDEIIKQGDIVRHLKAQKAEKSTVDNAVKILLSLKGEYKSITNTDWKPGCVPQAAEVTSIANAEPVSAVPDVAEINNRIIVQGEKVFVYIYVLHPKLILIINLNYNEIY